MAVQKRLREFVLDVELRVEPGITLVVGPSGSGKTTLLRIIAGLERPDAGRIALDERELDAGRRHVPAAERKFGFVFQDYALFPHLSVEQNVAYGLEALGVPAEQRAARVHRILEALHIGGLGGARPATLSGGEQQRVALARALVIEPEGMLLDEPLASLDPRTRERVRGELARTLGPLRIPTLMVTHDDADVAMFPERVVRIERGRIL